MNFFHEYDYVVVVMIRRATSDGKESMYWVHFSLDLKIDKKN